MLPVAGQGADEDQEGEGDDDHVDPGGAGRRGQGQGSERNRCHTARVPRSPGMTLPYGSTGPGGRLGHRPVGLPEVSRDASISAQTALPFSWV